MQVGLPGGTTAYVAAGDAAVLPAANPLLPATGDAVIADAEKFLGLPYLWAGTSAFGFDCSGLVYTVYRAHGIDLPRDADPQSQVGTEVARADLQPGDLLFFGSPGNVVHVAIYAGSGMFIHSPQTGQPVQYGLLASEPYNSSFVVARRVLP